MPTPSASIHGTAQGRNAGHGAAPTSHTEKDARRVGTRPFARSQAQQPWYAGRTTEAYPGGTATPTPVSSTFRGGPMVAGRAVFFSIRRRAGRRWGAERGARGMARLRQGLLVSLATGESVHAKRTVARSTPIQAWRLGACGSLQAGHCRLAEWAVCRCSCREIRRHCASRRSRAGCGAAAVRGSLGYGGGRLRERGVCGAAQRRTASFSGRAGALAVVPGQARC